MKSIFLGIFISLAFGVQSTGWCKKMPAWTEVATSDGRISPEGASVAVGLLEKNVKTRRPPKQIGNVGFPENHNRRKLRIVVTPGSHGKARKIFEFPFPSETVLGDPCSIRQLDSLAVEKQMIRIAINYQYACGSGSGGNAEFTISVMDEALQINSIVLSYASRDRSTRTSVNYLKGTIIYFVDLHEEEAATAPKEESISADPEPLKKSSFLQCPLPFAPQPLPACAH